MLPFFFICSSYITLYNIILYPVSFFLFQLITCLIMTISLYMYILLYMYNKNTLLFITIMLSKNEPHPARLHLHNVYCIYYVHKKNTCMYYIKLSIKKYLYIISIGTYAL